MSSIVTPAYVLTVRENNVFRQNFIKHQLESKGIAFQFMLQGDISDMKSSEMSLYFSDEIVQSGAKARESCTYKHILIYKSIIESDARGALVFEDDMFLADDFVEVYNKSIQELYSRQDINPERAFISYENSLLEFIPESRKVKDQLLYKTTNTRCAGAYYLSKNVAASILEYTHQHKLNFAMDWQHKHMAEKGIIDVYWCEPAIAEQGSHNGKIPSLLDDKKHGILRQISWNLQRTYKKILRLVK